MILVCAATGMEMEACLAGWAGAAAAKGAAFGSLEPFQDADRAWVRTRGDTLFAITGVGIPMTLLRLPPLLSRHRFSLILNAGIAGAYPGSGLAIGDLAAGESESFGDLGMETPDERAFLPLASFPWADEAYKQPLPLVLEPLRLGKGAGMGTDASGPDVPSLPRPARGCTVNACTGTEATGALRRRISGADFETMEGAAVALAGREAGVPVCELRAISNHASTRDFRPENAAAALGNLGVYMGLWLERNA